MVAFILSPKNSGLRKMREKAFGFLKNTDKARIIELRGEDIPLMAEAYLRPLEESGFSFRKMYVSGSSRQAIQRGSPTLAVGPSTPKKQLKASKAISQSMQGGLFWLKTP